MAKISPLSSKYIVHATIDIEGVVDRPDVVGAIFGQIEGLLGADLELRELQRSGRIGRIEVDVSSKAGKTSGTITIPSSLDKAETAIIGGALEIIERIGPCNANIKVKSIEDERAAKRQLVINRAKELLKNLDSDLPDSQELSHEVSDAIKISGMQNWGPDKLPAGPDIDEEAEIILVEGRADVLNLLKHGFKNVISMNGTSIPDSIKELTKSKTVTVFTDGDRGGDIIIQDLLATADINFITKAPDGKEVEELQKKEIHQAIRGRISSTEWKPSRGRRPTKQTRERPQRNTRGRQDRNQRNTRGRQDRPQRQPRQYKPREEEAEQYKTLLKDLKKSKAAFLLDRSNNVLGKVPIKDLTDTLPSLQEVSVVVMNGDATDEIGEAFDKARGKLLVATGGEPKMRRTFLNAKEL